MNSAQLYYKLKHDIADFVVANDASVVDVVGVVSMLYTQIMKNPFQFVEDTIDETTKEAPEQAAKK